MLRTATSLVKLDYWNLLVPKFSGKIAVTGISLGLILGSVYLLTRPCVFGECQEIAQAQKLADNAVIAAISSPAEPTILKVRQQLQESQTILETIPWWSNSYREATILLREYQEKSQELEILVQAIKTADRAKIAANNYPLTLKQWQEVCQLWQNAITTLAVIPKQSIFQASAKRQQQEYAIYLAQSQGLLAAEKQATDRLKLAEIQARSAEVQESEAKSATDWQSVQKSWQSAILQLQAITQGTTSYRQAQQLLVIYNHHLIKAGNRARQAESAAHIYRQAIEQAKLAKAAELKNQWRSAVTHWRSALTAIRQVPQNSIVAGKSEPLAILYSLSLSQAEKKLQIAVEQEIISDKLDKICQTSVRICNYYIGDTSIKITLVPDYFEKIRIISLNAQDPGTQQLQIELLNHVAQLEKDLQIMSKIAKKRIELYNVSGGLMSIY